MATTPTQHEKTTDRSTDCDTDWCDGPTSDTLPCFDCFYSDREYELEANK